MVSTLISLYHIVSNILPWDINCYPNCRWTQRAVQGHKACQEIVAIFSNMFSLSLHSRNLGICSKRTPPILNNDNCGFPSSDFKWQWNHNISKPRSSKPIEAMCVNCSVNPIASITHVSAFLSLLDTIWSFWWTNTSWYLIGILHVIPGFALLCSVSYISGG